MIKKIINNFLLYTSSFLISLYLHKESIFTQERYVRYFGVYIISWAIAALISRKFKGNIEFHFFNKLYTYTVSFFLMLGIFSFIIYNFDLTSVSRFIILSSFMISFSGEMIILFYENRDKINLKNFHPSYSLKAFSFEVLLFGIINLFIINNLRGNLFFNFQNLLLFLFLYLSWFIGSFLGYQFHPAFRRKDYWSFKWQYIKSYIIIGALASFSGFIIRLEMWEMVTIIYGIIIYSLLSFIAVSFFYYIFKHRLLVLNIAGFPVKGISGDILLNEKEPVLKNSYRSSFIGNDSELLSSKLKNVSLRRYPEVFEFLSNTVDMSSFDETYSLILKSDNTSNIDFLPEKSLQFFLNLEKINNIRYLNDYFAEVNNKLMENGIFVGNFETSYLRHQLFFKNYPYYFAQTFYFFDFLWNRVLSKTGIFKKIYLWSTGGVLKVLSLAEGLGRLHFCGFEVLNLKIIEGTMFFIAKKTSEPIKDFTPSTGLLFKMRRLGKNGKTIYVYKIRTMHPYAEYLQEFVYKKFNLQEGGKFKNDFRITYWGRILRKLWLDELPMIFNLLNGDLKLVGCRPLSKHYFSLYDDELKEKRLKVKPGLIPPFYADNPKTLEEIIFSEKKYLAAYSKNPIITDIKYFFRCIFNILLKGSRSS